MTVICAECSQVIFALVPSSATAELTVIVRCNGDAHHVTIEIAAAAKQVPAKAPAVN